MAAIPQAQKMKMIQMLKDILYEIAIVVFVLLGEYISYKFINGGKNDNK